jgi:peptidoglycan hydrolase-like protein with peptidoglycan-binding domain
MKTTKLVRNAAALAVIVSAGLTLGDGIAAADTGSGSFPGCPLLLENRSTGPCVTRLQNDLNAVNEGYHLDPDGVFGADTRIAVLDFQGRNHLGADGNVGTVTADELSRQAAIDDGNQEQPTPPESTEPERRGDPGGVIDTGKSAPECFLEAVKDKVPDEVVEKIIEGHLPKNEVGKQLKKYLGTPLDVAKAVKCVFIG